MGKLTRRDQSVLDAVAGHVSASWQKTATDWPSAYLTLAGRRIAVDVARLPLGTAERRNIKRFPLRFDRVVLRLVGAVQTALRGVVPNGVAVVFTLTAPIRLPAKTTDELVSRLRDALTRRSAPVRIKDTIHGNQIRVRLVKGLSPHRAQVIGFVHNPDAEADIIVDLTQALLRLTDKARDALPARKFTGERWLVLADAGRLSIETYRQVWAQISLPAAFGKVLLVRADGQVETLAER